MATIKAALQPVSGAVSGKAFLWEGLSAANADGNWIECWDHPEKTVQIVGTFDSGTLTMQGSNDGVTAFNLTDPQGNSIAKSAAAGEIVTENPRYIRPVLSGAGTDDVDVYVMAVRQGR